MSWVEVFAVFVVSHAVGDFLLQTEFQAVHKRGGLGADPVARRALASHVAHLHARLPARPDLARRRAGRGRRARGRGRGRVPHGVQDDGRLLGAYARTVKHTDPEPGMLMLAVDQSFHLVVLFALALAAAA